MKISVLSVFVMVLALSYQSCQGVPSKSPDGTIVWDPLPWLGSFVVEPEQYKTDGNRPATLAAMSSGWVDFIQPKGFPIDYVVHLIEVLTGDEKIDVMDEVLQGMSNFVGIIVCFLIGILFFLLLPLIAIIFGFCRCSNNCGGKLEQEDSNLCCKQVCYSIAFAMSLAVLCAGAVCIDTSNSFMTTAKDASFQTALDITNDLQTFTDGSVAQLDHILKEEYEFVEELTISDLQNAGKLIADPVFLEELKMQALFDDFEKLISDLDDTNATLHNMDSSRDSLIMTADTLSAQLANVSDTLDSINTTCAGCVPPNNGLTVNINFTLLPSFDDQINGADVAKGNITNLYNEGVQALDQIAIDINKAAEDPIDEIESVINTTSDQIKDLYSNVEKQLASVSDMLVDVEDFINDKIGMIDEYQLYRDYFMLALALTGFLIFGIFCVGLILGSIFSKNVDPTQRSAGANCCGNFLMFGVVLTFLLTPLLMLFTSLFFVSLAPVTLTCKPLKNLKLINETVDQPGLISEGYLLAELLLGNSSIPLTFTSLLEDCDKNSTIYSALKLENIINVNDLEKLLTEVRDQADQLADEIDIGDVDLDDLVPDNLDAILQYFVDQIQLEQMNYTALEVLLQEEVTTDDLTAYSVLLDIAANNESDPSAHDLRQAADSLRQIQQYTVSPMEGIMASMLSDSSHLQDLIPQLELDVNDTAKAASVVQVGLSNTTALEDELDTSIGRYIDGVIGYLDQFIDIAIQQLVEEFGRCYPIRAVYDASINLMCYYDLDSLNTFWFALGWCVFWMIVSLIFAVKLAKYLRIMQTVKTPKNRVADEQRVRSGSDAEEGRGNPGNHTDRAEVLYLTDTNHRNDTTHSNAPPFAPPPSYEESVKTGYVKEIQC